MRQLEAVVDLASFKCGDGIIREKHICQVLPEISSMFIAPVNRPFLGKKGAAFVSGERKRYESALIESRGDRNIAAKILEVSRATFFRRAKELGVIEGRRNRSN